MNKVKEGYKMTELGEIPDEWRIDSVENVTKEHKQGYYTKNDYVDDGIYLIRITDLNKPKIVFVDMPKVEIDKKTYEQFKIEDGDFLFARSGAIGKYGIYRSEYPKAVFASYIIRFRFNSSIINNRYFGYFYESNYSLEQINSITQGSSNININANNIKSLKICIPPLEEQQKISSILSSVDEKIGITDNLIEKTKELKKGLMQRLLTKGIGHDRFKDTDIGRIPEEWEIKSLNEIAHRIGDGLHGTPIYSECGSYCFINGNNLTNGKILLTNETKKVSESEFSKYKKELTNSTILISLNGTIGNLAYYNFEKVVLGKSAGYIALKDIVNKDYVFFALSSNKVQSHFCKELTGTTIKNLSLGTLRNTNIPIPNIGEQKQISLILSSVDEKIDQYETKKEKLQELKKGLMQKLLTGKIRVKV